MLNEANYWIFVIAICQHTKSLQGRVDGTWCRGWDYLVRATRRVVDEVGSAEAMEAIDATRLRAILSDDFDPDLSSVDRVEERLAQLHEVAGALLAEYEGQAMNIYCHAGGHLRGAGGIFERLGKIPHFGDPLEKKANCWLLSSTPRELAARGPENLKVCMDYHAMRVALRTGIVEVTDPGLLIALKAEGARFR